MQKILFFDFDGTIVDTKSIYYNEILRTMKIFGYKYKDVDKAIDLGLSLRRTLKMFGLSYIASFIFKRRIMKNIEEHIDEVKKCKDVDSIKNLNKDYKKILVSNSLKEFIKPILKRLKLKKYFNEVYGADNFTDKADFIKEYIKRKNINKNICYYIGDRAADVLVARKAGCKSIIISGKCAWDPRKEIVKQEPDFIIEDIKDLNRILIK